MDTINAIVNNQGAYTMTKSVDSLQGKQAPIEATIYYTSPMIATLA